MSSLFIDRVRKCRAKSRSQAFVEFAFVLPIFLTLMCGVIDYGYMIGNAMVIAMAAREGANAGARQLTLPVMKGLDAAYSNALSRLDLRSTNGGEILTRVIYNPALSTTYFILVDLVYFTNSCDSKGYIYGGGDALRNKSRILNSSVATNAPSLLPTRSLPMPVTVLDPNNQVMTAMEIFYTNQFVSPIGNLIGMVTPSVLYDVAFF